jgi:F-type H+-transporting ATPase subunit delta
VGLLLVVADEVHRAYNAVHEVQVAKVTTTFPLDEAMRQEVKAIVTRIAGSEKVELHEVIDQDIIGGILLRVGDRQVDDTIRTRLRTLRKELTVNLYEKQF